MHLQTTNGQRLKWCMQEAHAFEPRRLLQFRHNNRQHKHSGRSHQNPRKCHLRNTLGRSDTALAHFNAILVLHANAVDQLILAHQWDIHTVCCGHCGKWHISLWIQMKNISTVLQRSHLSKDIGRSLDRKITMANGLACFCKKFLKPIAATSALDVAETYATPSCVTVSGELALRFV